MLPVHKKMGKLVYNCMPFKKELFLIIKRIYKMPQGIYKHLYFKGIFNVRVQDKVFKLHHFGYELENKIFWTGLNGDWEKMSVFLWIELCKHSDFIMDIGANTGIYSLIAKTVNPGASVHAFEPIKRIREKMALNCAINKYDVVLEEIAVSNYDGNRVIHEQNSEHLYSATFNKDMFLKGDTLKTNVRTERLDIYIKRKNIPRVDLIKIDVEGHEPEVLEGMGSCLGDMRPVILMEILDDKNAMQIEKALDSKDYLYFNINEKGSLRQVKHLAKSDSYNFLIAPKEIAEKIKIRGII